jgi:hypothetical protein
MTITARYPGKCSQCGGAIEPGQAIEWDKETKRTSHTECPALASVARATPKAEVPVVDDGTIQVRRTGQYRGDCPEVGEVFRFRDKGLYAVTRASREYISEDGMSVGLMAESGWMFRLACRPATDEEAAPVLAREEESRKRKEAIDRLSAIARQIRKEGEYAPKAQGKDDRNVVMGERLCDTQDIYGGGTWFVIAADFIWHVANNGGDGSDWAANNVATGGAGGIGHRVPMDAVLAEEIRTLAPLAKGVVIG